MVAPLYKRYIPPKTPTTRSAHALRTSNGGEEDLGKKRKRNLGSDPSLNHHSTQEHIVKTAARDENAPKNNVINVAARQTLAKAAPPTSQRIAKKAHFAQDLHDISREHFTGNELAATSDGKPSKPKRKRRKKSKSTAVEESENRLPSEESESGELAKHTSVLSKFEKSVKAKNLSKHADTPLTTSPTPTSKVEELRDLVPIPRPPKPQSEEKSNTIPALPEWIGQPMIVSDASESTFHELGVDSYLIEQLVKKGISKPLPIQAGMLPLLLPTLNQHNGDVCASATTGSGKTLGYVLPIVQSLRMRADVQLRALVIVPTRELVTQVQETFELVSAGTGIKLGTATGSTKFVMEQTRLMKERQVFVDEKHHSRFGEDSVTFTSDVVDQDESLQALPLHVSQHRPNVDILICTPGRLVDHIKLTRGFSLQSLQWLVIDEADRLLDQSFQEWARILIQATLRSPYEESPWIRTLDPSISMGLFHPVRPKLKKIVLSATMTTDLDKLDSLRLNNPRLVLLSGPERGHALDEDKFEPELLDVPRNLVEHAIPVDDSAEKPLILLSLLARIMPDIVKEVPYPASDSDPPGESNEGLETDSDSGQSSSPYDSVSSSSSTAASSKFLGEPQDDESSSGLLNLTARPEPTQSSLSSTLIFTNSLESAQRLHSLLSFFIRNSKKGEGARNVISTLTKVNSQAVTNKLLRKFDRGNIRILVATDRASRGLDLPTLSHVINYDIPNKLNSYIHRVGRTARAGRQGDAWTLVEHREARWFWNVIGKRHKGSENDGELKNVVERVRLSASDLGDGIQDRYKDALKQLQREVYGR